MDHVSTQPLHDLAKTLERLTPKLSELSIAIGFDAFIDETIRIVGEHSTPESYTPMPTIGEYGELVRRIFSTDPDERMPPPESHKQLDEAQKELLKRWISEGAEYQPHWAFILPKKSPPPAVEQNRWARNSIDGYILARFEREPRTNSINE